MVNTQVIAKVESQIGQIATHLGERDKAKFPSQPMTNPKAYATGNSSDSTHGHEQVQSVTLRLGRQVDNKVVREEEDSEVLQGKESGRDKGEKAEPSRAIPIVEDP